MNNTFEQQTQSAEQVGETVTARYAVRVTAENAVIQVVPRVYMHTSRPVEKQDGFFITFVLLIR